MAQDAFSAIEDEELRRKRDKGEAITEPAVEPQRRDKGEAITGYHQGEAITEPAPPQIMSESEWLKYTAGLGIGVPTGPRPPEPPPEKVTIPVPEELARLEERTLQWLKGFGMPQPQITGTAGEVSAELTRRRRAQELRVGLELTQEQLDDIVRSRIAVQRAKSMAQPAPGEWVNPMAKLMKSGKMARLHACSRNRALTNEQGRAITKVFDVARDSSDEEITAQEWQDFKEGAAREGQPQTTSSIDFDNSVKRIIKQAEQQLTTGKAKLAERLAAGPVESVGEWNELVAESFSPLVKGQGLIIASMAMPKQLINQANVDLANRPFYRQWLIDTQEIRSSSELDIAVSKIHDEGPGQALYEEFKGAEGSRAWNIVTDAAGKIIETSQNTKSASQLKLEAERRAQKQAEIAVGSREFKLDPMNEYQIALLHKAGVSEAATEFRKRDESEDKTALEAELERIAQTVDLETIQARAGITLSRLVVNAKAAFLGQKEKDIEGAIKEAITKGINDGILEKTSPKAAYLAYRKQIRESMGVDYDKEIQSGQDELARKTGQRRLRLIDEMGTLAEQIETTFSESALLGLTANVDEEGDIPAAVSKYFTDHFQNLSDADSSYLNSALYTEVTAPGIAATNNPEFHEVYRRVMASFSRGLQIKDSARVRADNARQVKISQALTNAMAERPKAFDVNGRLMWQPIARIPSLIWMSNDTIRETDDGQLAANPAIATRVNEIMADPELRPRYEAPMKTTAIGGIIGADPNKWLALFPTTLRSGKPVPHPEVTFGSEEAGKLMTDWWRTLRPEEELAQSVARNEPLAFQRIFFGKVDKPEWDTLTKLARESTTTWDSRRNKLVKKWKIQDMSDLDGNANFGNLFGKANFDNVFGKHYIRDAAVMALWDSGARVPAIMMALYKERKHRLQVITQDILSAFSALSRVARVDRGFLGDVHTPADIARATGSIRYAAYRFAEDGDVDRLQELLTSVTAVFGTAVTELGKTANTASRELNTDFEHRMTPLGVDELGRPTGISVKALLAVQKGLEGVIKKQLQRTREKLFDEEWEQYQGMFNDLGRSL